MNEKASETFFGFGIKLYPFVCDSLSAFQLWFIHSTIHYFAALTCSEETLSFDMIQLGLNSSLIETTRLETSCFAHAVVGSHLLNKKGELENFQVDLVIAILPAHRWNLSCDLFFSIHRINTRIWCSAPFPWV